jgi:hypothetical protein
MNPILLLTIIIMAGVGVGCTPKAPTVKRVPSYDQIDERYLKDIFAPNYGGSRLLFSNSVSHLEQHWAEFKEFMNQVETGKIPVTQGFKGEWHSVIRRGPVWMAADYSGRLGMVADFQQRNDEQPHPLIYSFRFSAEGRLTWAETMDDLFEFDANGRVVGYWRK